LEYETFEKPRSNSRERPKKTTALGHESASDGLERSDSRGILEIPSISGEAASEGLVAPNS